MSKIGLVAVTNHNYGSILQTFALQEAVRAHGHETEILKYAEPPIAKFKRFKNFEYGKTRLKRVYRNFVIGTLYKHHKQNLSTRAKAFQHFINSELSMTVACHSLSDLTCLCHRYDAILLGSDQVWHPMNLEMNFFTLNFVPAEVKKGAYAPSFGVSKLPVSYEEPYRKFIGRIEYVSCREKAGTALIEKLTGRKVPMVCDPTLLLNGSEWAAIADRCASKENGLNLGEVPYIFCYFIGNNPNQRKLVNEFKKKHGCKVVALQHINEYIPSDEEYADYTPYNVGPAEFLQLVRNAKYVMTDSFHASVFSLQFHRNFYVFDRFENGIGNSTTSRIDSLLGKVGLMDRKIRHDASLADLDGVGVIDYHNVDLKLSEFRKTSQEYLSSIIDG